jgi:uncharacterized membrane protein
MKLLTSLICVLCLAACGSDSDDPSLASGACAADAGPVPLYSQVDAFNTCTKCHSAKLTGSARREAPANVNFDTYEAAKANAEEAVSQVHGGSMPPASAKLTLTAAEKDDLYRWGLCGTPNG